MTRSIPGQKEVVEMALAGKWPGEIADLTGLSINTIYSDLSAARRAGQKVPKFNRGRARKLGRDVRIPRTALNALEAEAVRRGLTVTNLAGMILTRAAEDNLAGAILDDGV